jgi:lipopolysaccharide/colanic/teichoic acid biosynthesis glycosyltransferase
MPVAQFAPHHTSGAGPVNALSDPDLRLFDPEQGFYAWCRYLVELPATVVLLVVTAPFVLIAATLVRLTSKGPAIYAQVRLGRDGQPFRVFKIRSMIHDCERLSGPKWSNGRDPRVTPVGRIIRRLHIDELPQLWNVLRGEMSLIGPRPERPEFVEKLERAIPRYRERLRVRPGITGLAQVQWPADIDIEGARCKLAYDLYYVENLNAWLDFRISLCTIAKLVGMPFSMMRALFRMPAKSQVELLYWQAVPKSQDRRRRRPKAMPAAMERRRTLALQPA